MQPEGPHVEAYTVEPWMLCNAENIEFCLSFLARIIAISLQHTLHTCTHNIAMTTSTPGGRVAIIVSRLIMF